MFIFYLNLIFWVLINPLYLYLYWDAGYIILICYQWANQHLGIILAENWFEQYGTVMKTWAIIASYIMSFIVIYLATFILTFFVEILSGPASDKRFKTGYKNNEVPDTITETLRHSLLSPFRSIPFILTVYYLAAFVLFFYKMYVS